jgi:hypothetical protein
MGDIKIGAYMGKSILRRRAILVLLSAALVAAAETGEPGAILHLQPAAGDADLGMLFSVDDLLLDVESYQAGIGFKRRAGAVAVRGLLDVVYSSSGGVLSVFPGITIESHFLPGSVSPYVGGSLTPGIISQRTEVDAVNWIETITLPISAAAVLGVEIFVAPFLSLFVEYSAGLTMNIVIDNVSVAGSVTSTTATDYAIDFGIGNQGKIGIAVYLQRQ